MKREDIYSAIYDLLGKLPQVQTLSRRLRHWDDVTEFPAIFLIQKSEFASKSGRGVPTKWTFFCEIYLYVKAETGLPGTPDLNEMLDEITNALAAPAPMSSNRQTLGGLVEDCWIDGNITTDEGVLGELAVAIIPIHIIVAP